MNYGLLTEPKAVTCSSSIFYLSFLVLFQPMSPTPFEYLPSLLDFHIVEKATHKN